MARSMYVYVVQDTELAGAVVATFTVKHELAGWLELFGHKHPLLFINRHRDGRPARPSVTLNPKTLEPAT